MPQFLPLSTDGGRKWQSHWLYFVYSANGKRPIHTEEQRLIMSLFSTSNTVLVLETFFPQRSMKKTLKLLEKCISPTILLPFIVSRTKQASS